MRWRELTGVGLERGYDCVSQSYVEGVLFCRVVYAPGCSMTAHQHSEAAFSVLLEGSAAHRSDRAPLEPVVPGRLDYHPSRFHDWNVGPDGATALEVIVLDPGRPLGGLVSARLTDRTSVSSKESRRFAGQVSGELRTADSTRPLALQAALAEATLSVELRSRALRAESARAPWLRRTVDALQDLGEDRSLTELAELAGVAPTYLSAQFRTQIGITIGDYRRSVRLDHARRLLRQGESTVSTVAHEAGFFDQAHFVRVFKGRFGMAPSVFAALSAGRSGQAGYPGS